MKKRTRNTLLIAIAVISLMLGGAHVYASNSLDSTLFSMIGLILEFKKPEVVDKIDSTMTGQMSENRSEVVTYIDSATDRVIRNIDIYIAEEAERYGKEFEVFWNELKLKIDRELLKEEDRLKDLTTERIDSYIHNLKIEVYYELFNELGQYIVDLLES